MLQARAWTEVAAGDLVAARKRLEEAAAMAKWSGAYALESAALHDLARLGRAEQTASRLRALTGVVEGDLAPARADHAAALAAQDAAGLDAASAAFERCGAELLAAEAAADAAVAWRRRGEFRRATASGRRSTALAACCEGARTQHDGRVLDNHAVHVWDMPGGACSRFRGYNEEVWDEFWQ